MNLNRSQVPLPQSEIKFSLPKIKKFTLSNGLKVGFIQRDLLPLLKLSLITNCGSFFDPKDKNGLAHLFTLMIDEGAGKYSALELSEEFEILGSSFSASCNHDNVFLSLKSLSENFERSMELFSSIILEPHFKDEDFQRERRKVQVRLLQQKDEPEELADLAFERIVHAEKNPYSFSTLGYDEGICDLSIEDVKTFYEKNFSPKNSFLAVTGNISEHNLIDLLEKHLNKWNTQPPKKNIEIVNVKNNKHVYILHKEGAVQTEIRVGHQASKRNVPDYFAKTIMNLILGGQFTSRINLNLREDKGFTYGSSSNFVYHKHIGEFCISTSVSIENTKAAVNEILHELEGIKKGVTRQELDFAKSSTIRRFPANFESDSQVISNLSLIAIHNLPDNYFDTYIDNITKVTIEEVNKAAVDNIKLDELSIVLVGDEKKLTEQFAKELDSVKLVNEKGQII